jgi:hypothetical protein
MKPVFVTNPESLEAKGIVSLDMGRDGVKLPIDFHITTKGSYKIRERLLMERPIPPKRLVKLQSDDPSGQESTDEPRFVADEIDPYYLTELRRYEIHFIWETVLTALDMEIRDANGNVITDHESMKVCLAESGLSFEGLQILFNAVVSLQKISDQKCDDIAKSSLGLTKAILGNMEKLARKRKSEFPSNDLFNQTRLMEIYHMTPQDWNDLCPEDKQILLFSQLYKNFLEASEMDRMERENKLNAQKQQVMGSLPTFNRGNR